MLLIGGVIWFILFPLTVFTLKTAKVFPLTYFGIPFAVQTDMFIPPDLLPMIGAPCIGLTLLGLFTIYFNVRNLRRLRRGEYEVKR
jgi:uncharacterized membrane protein YccF (DUF307 family)